MRLRAMSNLDPILFGFKHDWKPKKEPFSERFSVKQRKKTCNSKEKVLEIIHYLLVTFTQGKCVFHVFSTAL